MEKELTINKIYDNGSRAEPDATRHAQLYFQVLKLLPGSQERKIESDIILLYTEEQI